MGPAALRRGLVALYCDPILTRQWGASIFSGVGRSSGRGVKKEQTGGGVARMSVIGVWTLTTLLSALVCAVCFANCCTDDGSARRRRGYSSDEDVPSTLHRTIRHARKRAVVRANLVEHEYEERRARVRDERGWETR